MTSGGGKLKQADREKSLQALMTTNLLKRLESSVQSFRLTLESLKANHVSTLGKIRAFSGGPKSTLKKSYDFQELLTLFSPRPKESH